MKHILRIESFIRSELEYFMLEYVLVLARLCGVDRRDRIKK